MPTTDFKVPAKADPGLTLEEMKQFVHNHFENFVNRKKSEVALGDHHPSKAYRLTAIRPELIKEQSSCGYTSFHRERVWD